MLEAIRPVLRGALRSPFSKGLDLSFSIGSLFAAGEQGAWYDPSDMSTMFQDAAGTVPVTGMEQPVGLILDKSKGLVLGPELVTNGDFSNPVTTGWVASNSTLNAVSSKLRISMSGAASVGQASYPISVVSGRSYKISAELAYVSGAAGQSKSISIRNGTDSATSTALLFLAITTSDSPIVFSGIYTATTTGTVWLAFRGGIAGSAYVLDADNISVRELPGNHATQTTSTSRPLLQQDGNGKYYLSFDGVDDWLVTPSIDFTATDKMTVFAGLSKFNQNITSALAELSQNINFNNGAFFIGAPTSTNSYQFNSKGTSEALAPVPASKYPSPSKNVITCLGDISGDSLSMRVNGIQEAISTADQGTGNYGNYPLFIGRRGGTLLPFNGRMYSLIVRGAQSTAQQISDTEAWVNGKTGAY